MARATHIVGFRHFTYGKWREPATQVDASSWPNRGVLEESGYLKALPPDADVEVPEDPQPTSTTPPPANDAASAAAPAAPKPLVTAKAPPPAAKKKAKDASQPKKPKGAR